METERKITLGNENYLSFHPERIRHTYGVLLKYPEKDISVHYEIECRYERNAGDYHFLLSLNRKQVFVNNEVPAMKLYQMADVMVKAFYPVELYINKTDLEIKKIGNHAEIIERCQQAEEQLAVRYKGELADTFFKQFTKQYTNGNILTDRLMNELFYKLYFFPLYQRYTADFSVVSNFRFPFSEDQENPLLEITHQISPVYTDTELIKIDLKGSPLDEQGNPLSENMEIGFQASYYLYGDDHTISMITGKAFYQTIMQKKSTIEFEVYHLDAEKRNKELVTGNNVNTLTAPAEVEKKKSFWNIFN